MSGPNIAGSRPMSQFLRMAVMAGVESAVQIHLDRGDDLNARDASGMTPLMLSAARNRPIICKMLLNAGADCGLLDLSGKTALEIAVAAGSNDSAAVLAAALAPTLPTSDRTFDPEPDPISEPAAASAPRALEATTAVKPEFPPEPDVLPEPPAPEPAPTLESDLDLGESGEFDLAGWEAEEEPTRPEADVLVLHAASAIQIAITSHEPLDTSAGWDDVDAYLPEVALPLARADDAERCAQLRRLLLRAIREGSVPSLDVQALSANEDRSANAEAAAFLSMVVNDLGAEADERFEYTNAAESFEVFVDPRETTEEEAALDEALNAIDRAASPRHRPLQIYQREFQRIRLLTAKEEIQLAQDMETALDAALDALAAWPDGIELTLAAGAEAITGQRLLTSVWAGAAEPEPVLMNSFEAGAPGADAPEIELIEEASDEAPEPVAEAPADEPTSFSAALRQLGALTERREYPFHEIRQTLSALRLNRSFLWELVDAADGLAPCPGFHRALASFRIARDRMTEANLKLAFYLAKKYLYSGEPLDDLAQEGNIGLLKAVDRYDWRRGFRFSTYATWWIRQHISRYVADKARTIRIPVHIYERAQRMQRTTESFETTFGREPTVDEMAVRMDMPIHKLTAVRCIAPEPSRIDEIPIDDMVAVEARDTYSSPDPADVVDEIQLRSAVHRLLSSLSTKDLKEEDVLRLRFGINCDEALTLEEIGTHFGLTRERIRQIEAKAIKKLRHPVRSEPFARRALGIDYKQLSLDADREDSITAETTDPTEATAEPTRAARPPRDSFQIHRSVKPQSLDSVLAQAKKLGVPVDDERSNVSGRIWVRLLATPDNPHRRFMRMLIELGFEHSPGKGYWR